MSTVYYYQHASSVFLSVPDSAVDRSMYANIFFRGVGDDDNGNA